MTARAEPAQRRLLRLVRRRLLWHRRLITAGLTAAAVGAGLLALSPPAEPTVGVVRLSRDVPAGVVLDASSVEVSRLSPDAVPDGALRFASEAVGRVLASPARRGEPVTDARLVGASLLDGYGADAVGAPVRIADAQAVSLLRPGDVVDVLAADVPGDGDESGRAAVTVAHGVRVVTVPAAGRDGWLASGAGDGGALVVLATSPQVARDLARAAVASRLSIVLRPTATP
jgi:Flp pilus assembly protein CpaB